MLMNTFSFFALTVSLTAHADSLPKLKLTDVTVSGVSSGAFMAVQLGTAFSKTISGVGSVAGGIYWCAEGDARRSQAVCMAHPEEVKPASALKKAKELAGSGAIDPLEGVAKQKVFVYTGTKDTVILPPSADKLAEFYRALGVADDALRLEKTLAAGHGFPTRAKGVDCGKSMPPWLNKCGFDGAGEILRHLLGKLAPRGKMVAASLRAFSQAGFGDEKTPLHKEGWVYVPAACAKGEACRLHVALHGCLMSPDFIQDKFVKDAGYNEWAETNRIVVLYPQSAKLAPLNPYACWDWFGFTGPGYVEKTGAQMSAIRKMIEALGAR